MLEQNNCLCFSVSEKSFGKKDIIKKNNKGEKLINTSLAAKGVLAYRLQRRTACNAAQPATPHRLQNPKWPPGGPKMAEGVWKGVYP